MKKHLKEIQFSIFQLIIGGKKPELANFAAIDEANFEKQTIGEDLLNIKKIEKEYIPERFIALCFEEGNKFPYSEKVIDSKLKESLNPRSIDKVELNEQFYVLVDLLTSRIYISDLRKKGFLINWLEDKIKKEIAVKPLIAQREFIDKIESIKEICFTVEPDLLNSASIGLPARLREDIFGFGATEAIIKLVYKNKKKIGKQLYEKVKDIIKNKTEYKNITVIGRTSEDFESIFNTQEVISKITLLAPMNRKNGKFINKELVSELIKKIHE
ncbi:MAG: hypothetical protein KW788_01265 [Candidatus Doudnabacteria bacterium]|nr:hypothetical protein [Candidatus Doudnabacteria bacterium]